MLWLVSPDGIVWGSLDPVERDRTVFALARLFSRLFP